MIMLHLRPRRRSARAWRSVTVSRGETRPRAEDVPPRLVDPPASTLSKFVISGATLDAARTTDVSELLERRDAHMSALERQQVEAIVTRLSTNPAQSFGATLAAWAHQAKN